MITIRKAGDRGYFDHGSHRRRPRAPRARAGRHAWLQVAWRAPPGRSRPGAARLTHARLDAYCVDQTSSRPPSPLPIFRARRGESFDTSGLPSGASFGNVTTYAR